MKYKKLLKWELFFGFLLIFVVTFFLLNLFVNTIFKNIFDKEINSRLDIIGNILQKEISPDCFALSDDFKDTFLYKKTLTFLNKQKEMYGIDFYLLNKNGYVSIGTSAEFNLIGKYLLNETEDYSITYFENNIPNKFYLFPYKSNNILIGYILMMVKGKFLNSFIQIKKMQLKLIIIIFILALLISFIFSYFFTLRIQNTVASIEKISKGDLNHRINIKWFDEFSYLQDQINKMIDNIKELQSSRYKEMQIIAMGLAHEIKNPLTAIFNVIEIIEKKIKTSTEIISETKKIKDEIYRLNNIINRFISFARDEKINKNSVILGDFINLLLNNYPDLKIQSSIEIKTLSINIDEVLMERAFKNLIKNSKEANANEIILEIISDGNYIIFRIIDNATLIADEIKDKIFIPFFTTKSDGMGIGLSITKNIIEKHGGSITYDSINNKNVFIIKLPLQNQE